MLGNSSNEGSQRGECASRVTLFLARKTRTQAEKEVPQLGFVILYTSDVARAYVSDFVANRLDRPPAAIEIGFLLDDVLAAYQRAIDAGFTSVTPPEKRPWGPTIAFVPRQRGCARRALFEPLSEADVLK
jgi:hypothetical protein